LAEAFIEPASGRGEEATGAPLRGRLSGLEEALIGIALRGLPPGRAEGLPCGLAAALFIGPALRGLPPGRAEGLPCGLAAALFIGPALRGLPPGRAEGLPCGLAAGLACPGATRAASRAAPASRPPGATSPKDAPPRGRAERPPDMAALEGFLLISSNLSKKSSISFFPCL
jgi:hypothetical protein